MSEEDGLLLRELHGAWCGLTAFDGYSYGYLEVPDKTASDVVGERYWQLGFWYAPCRTSQSGAKMAQGRHNRGKRIRRQ